MPRPATYKDMVKGGIIDPTKVVRAALQHAASIGSLMITTEAMVADHQEPADEELGRRRQLSYASRTQPSIRTRQIPASTQQPRGCCGGRRCGAQPRN